MENETIVIRDYKVTISFYRERISRTEELTIHAYDAKDAFYQVDLFITKNDTVIKSIEPIIIS